MVGKSFARQMSELDDIPPRLPVPGVEIPYTTAINRRVTDYCLLGCTNEELAGILGISLSTVERWMVDHAPFKRAILKGRIEADSKVSRSLYKRAVGMSVPETKVFNTPRGLETVDIKRHYPPSETAAALWLANRQPGKWKSKEANNTAQVDLAKLVEESLKRVNQAKAAQPGDDAEQVQAVVLQQEKGR